MKTFKDLLSNIAEKESDADYDRRMRQNTKTLKRNAKKGKLAKKKNVIKRRDNEKLDTAAREKAKRVVLKSLPDKMKPSAKKKKVVQKKSIIDRLAKKVKKDLKKAEPLRIKKAKASKLKK